MRILRALLTTCILGSFAACEPSPATITAPDQARFDNGSGFRSGHRARLRQHKQHDGRPPSTEGTAGDTTTAERGGSGFGSGH